MRLFALDHEVAELEARLPSRDDAERLAGLLELAWQLRQRDSKRAIECAEEADALLTRSRLSGAERGRSEARLQLVRAEVGWLAAELEVAQRLTTTALSTLRTLDDASGSGDAEWLLAFIHGDLGDTSRRDACLSSALEYYRACGDPERIATTVARRLLYAAFEDLSTTAGQLEREFKDLGHDQPVVNAWAASARAIAASPQGDFGTAVGQFMQSHRAALESGQLRQAIVAATNAADNFSILGDLDRALEWDEMALGLARRVGWPSMLGTALMQTGNVLRLLGRYPEAERALMEALAVRSRLTSSNGYTVTLGYLGDLHLDIEQPARALEYYGQAEKRAHDLGGAISTLRVWRGQALALSRLGDPAAALAKITAALAMAREHGSPDEHIEALRVCAELHLGPSGQEAAGSAEPERALECLDEAFALARSISGYALPAELLDVAARAHAARGDYAQAYLQAQAAARVREHNRAGRTHGLVLAMEERREIERAKRQAESHRRQVEAERIHAQTEYHRFVAQTEAHRASTFEETSRTLEILGQIGREITARLSAEEVYATLDRHVRDVLDVTSFDVYRLEPGGQVLQGVFGVEAGAPSPLRRIRVDDPVRFTARCVREREEITILKSAEEPCVNQVAGTLHTLSLMFFPLLIGDRLLGAMSVQSTRAAAYGERECSIFRTLCAYAAIALENAAAYAAAEKARHDADQSLSELRDAEHHRKQSEATRELLEAQLRESQKMEAVGTLAGGIAHDFNNMLAIILGNAELARRYGLDEPHVLKCLDEISKAGGRARDLVKQILSFSRRQPTERKTIPLPSVIDEAVRLLRATLPKRLVLEVHVASRLPEVRADATQIQQVIMNLVTNAMQAIGEQPGRIGIWADVVTLDAGWVERFPALHELHARHRGQTVVLAVTDSGPGMDKVMRARIFEPFFTTKPIGEGTGLGLSVVHGIVQSHDGAIVVESEPGHGATFSIYLPAIAIDAMLHAAADGPEPATRSPLGKGGAHILYLDDDEAVLSVVKRLIEQRGHRVSGYSDPREALAAIALACTENGSRVFELLVTDYNMPGMSGLEVARAARLLDARLPVAIASGFIDETLRSQADEAGVRELIFKADPEAFCDLVMRLLPEQFAATAASSEAPPQ